MYNPAHEGKRNMIRLTRGGDVCSGSQGEEMYDPAHKGGEMYDLAHVGRIHMIRFKRGVYV